jgi:hypothetical protein
MKINGPTTLIVKPSGMDPAPKGQATVAFGRRDFGFTKFPGPSALGPHTRALLDQLPPVTQESTVSLATALAQQQSVPEPDLTALLAGQAPNK